MYDENAYRQTYLEVNPLQCVFERAMLRRCVDCQQGIRRNIAEREAVGCRDQAAHDLCEGFKSRLKQAAMFVLRVTHPDDPLPFTKELKLQCGGLAGLKQCVSEPTAGVEDVAALLATALARHGELDALPYAEILPAVRAFEARQRRT
jgi:hypothetical protein